MAGIADLIAAGKELGIFEFYLPFILLFAIIYGLLQKSKIFGEPEKVKNINMIISLAASLFVMVFTPVGPATITMATFLSNLFAGTLMILVTIITFLAVVFMIASPIGAMPKEAPKKAFGVIVVGAIILATGVFVASGGLAIFPGIPLPITAPIIVLPWLTPQDLAIILVVLATGIVISWLAKGGKEERSLEASRG